ncbi:MAG: peptidoglycan DD-metalloendopeptidase family protein [Anaerolineae bacterium]|nr:peptidoglycan DD-metalloendopeptidase family protein [Anaerolineae bacterium]
MAVPVLNLREQPGTTFRILQRLPAGTWLALLQGVDADWVQVRVLDHADLTGYVARAFITPQTDTPPAPAPDTPLTEYSATLPPRDLPEVYDTFWQYGARLGLPPAFASLPVAIPTAAAAEKLWVNGFGPNYFAFLYWTGWYTRTGGMHGGFDFMVKQNTPLLAVSDGVIVQGWRFIRSPADRTVALWCFLPPTHRDSAGRRLLSNVLVAYAHMNDNRRREHLEVVRAGDEIGTSGTPAGSGSNAHLHLEVHLLEGDPVLPFARQPEARLLREYDRRQLQNNNTPWNPLLFFQPALVQYLLHQHELHGHARKAPGYPTPAMLRQAGVGRLAPLEAFTLAYYRYGMPVVWNNVPLTPDRGAVTAAHLAQRLALFQPFVPYPAHFLA